MLEVGKEYISRAGNLVKILERSEIEEAPGTFVYNGHYQRTIKGHESLERKLHWFFEDGSWVLHPGGIHDLVKEREKA